MEATCFCKKVTMRLNIPEGEQLHVHVCHCNDCKKISGSAFYTCSLVKTGQVSFQNPENMTCYEEVTQRGNHSKVYFCTTCGIFFKIEIDELKTAEDMILIPTGLFEKIPAPTSEYYAVRRCPWIQPTKAKQHETIPNWKTSDPTAQE